MIAIPFMPVHKPRSRERHSSFRAGIVAMGLLALGACTTPATRTVAADGDYRGSSTRFQVLRRNCPRPGLLHLPVRSATLFYPWSGQYVRVSILNNGTLSGALPGVQLTG